MVMAQCPMPSMRRHVCRMLLLSSLADTLGLGGLSRTGGQDFGSMNWVLVVASGRCQCSGCKYSSRMDLKGNMIKDLRIMGGLRFKEILFIYRESWEVYGLNRFYLFIIYL